MKVIKYFQKKANDTQTEPGLRPDTDVMSEPDILLKRHRATEDEEIIEDWDKPRMFRGKKGLQTGIVLPDLKDEIKNGI